MGTEEMEVRESRVLRRLHAGEVARSIKLNISDPRMVELGAMCGFDSIWLDMEHVPTDWKSIEEGVRAAKIYDADVVVRVEKGSYSDYVRPFEADAAGIIVPHVMCADEARNIVRTTRFHPTGMRPLDGGNADGAYCLIGFDDYMKQSNQRKFVCVQIEDAKSLPALDAIAEIEGIDMIFFGPGDFSQSIGHPGEWTHPDLVEARERIAKACRLNGKYAATVGGPGNYRQLVDMGYSYISIGADVVGLGEYFNKLLSVCV